MIFAKQCYWWLKEKVEVIKGGDTMDAVRDRVVFPTYILYFRSNNNIVFSLQFQELKLCQRCLQLIWSLILGT
jgi:hypothetical protein